MKEVTIVAFNYGNAGRYVNGPGMCLVNFVKMLRAYGITVNVYSKLKSNISNVKPLDDKHSMSRDMRNSSVFHHWSGIDSSFRTIINVAKMMKLKVLIGPNVIDTVNIRGESRFLNGLKYDKILTVNDRLIFKISKDHNIPLDMVDSLIVGPDLEMWKPLDDSMRNKTILWKGNSKQPVKDVGFALQLQRELPQFEFNFIGYPNPYNYIQHISEAKKSRISINTSLSETMGLSMMELLAASIPAISHPKIYMHGENYRTGIVTNKTINDYKEAIIEVMNDDVLYQHLKEGSVAFMNEKFSEETIVNQYNKIIGEL